MEKIIAKMRSDWSVVAEARRASGEWSEADEKEIGEAVKQAVAGKDATAIALWSRWLADLSVDVAFWRLIVKGAEAGMRNKAAEEKAKRAGAGK